MDQDNIHYLVKEALDGIGVRQVAITKLIKATFLFESDLMELQTSPIEAAECHGFSMISKDEFRSFLYDYVALRELRSQIENFCNVNLKDDFEDLWRRLKYDIGLQIAATYGIYDMKWVTGPNDNLSEIVEYYFRYWADQSVDSHTLDEYVEYYRDVFVLRNG